MKRLILKLIWVCVLTSIILLSFVIYASASEKAMFPMEYLNVSQGVNNDYSHKGRLAIDICGKDKGTDDFYAPFTGTIKKIYGSDNVVWLESNSPVEYADGTVDYMTIMCMHDNDISNLWVGKTVYQGEHFLSEGMAGTATGNHIHLECGRGKFAGTGWYKNDYGKWCINNGVNPWQALFLNESTVIIDDEGYQWKKAHNSDYNVTINTSHTCSGGKYLWYWSAHPHYNCYSCATCGKEWANKNETNYITSCSECNPPKQLSQVPSNAVLSINKLKFSLGETVIFSASSNGATGYTIGIDRDGTRIYTSDIESSFKKSFNDPGNYSAYVTAWNSAGLIDSSRVYFTVYDPTLSNEESKKDDGSNNNYYTITYNANGGSGAPASETIPNYDGVSESFKISSKEPTRSGYIFLGWSTNSSASKADYESGDRYYVSKDTTFYAVWEEKLETHDTCGRNLTWEYDSKEKTLQINGSGDMFNYDSKDDAPWCHLCNEVEKLVIEDGVTTVGDYAFYDFSKLEIVKIPITIESIGRSAFRNCDDIIETYYFGCEDEFDEIDIDSGNSGLCDNVEFEYYTVKFLNLKGNNIKSQKVKKFEQAVEPEEPTAEGFEFSCWMRSDDFSYNFNTRVTRDIVLKAKWEEVPKEQKNNKIILTIGKKEANVFGQTKINDVAPVMRNGRTMLPARFVAEALGATVEWNEEDEDVVITYNGIEMCIGVNETKVYFFKLGIMGGFTDCWQEYLDVSPFIENSRTFLPVRFIAEQLDADVEWNEKEQQVIITKT